jgi:hypothetical protein
LEAERGEEVGEEKSESSRGGLVSIKERNYLCKIKV